MEQDEASPPSDIFFVEDSDEHDEEFHSNRNDVEIGTAIPLQGLNLSNPSSDKPETQTNFFKRQRLYIAGFVLASVIIGLCIEIGILNRRNNAIIRTETPSSQPSSIPSAVPSLSPSVLPSSVPSLSKVVSRCWYRFGWFFRSHNSLYMCILILIPAI
jgi:hypothetical protein